MTKRRTSKEPKTQIWDENGTTTNPGNAEFAPDAHLRGLPEEQREFLKNLEEFGSIRQACRRSNVTRWFVDKWCAESETFKQAFEYAKHCRIENVEDAAFEAATNGQWSAVEKILESHKPETYGPRTQKHDVNVSGNLSISQVLEDIDGSSADIPSRKG